MIDRVLTEEEMALAIAFQAAMIAPRQITPFERWRAICKAQRDLTRKELLEALGELGVTIHLASGAGKPVIEFDDGDFVEQTGALVDFLMHLNILMPNCNLPDDLTIIPTKTLCGKWPEEE